MQAMPMHRTDFNADVRITVCIGHTKFIQALYVDFLSMYKYDY